VLITGRTLYQFHTRTKTARVPQLQAAAPQVWVECSAADAQRLGVAEGDQAEVASPVASSGRGCGSAGSEMACCSCRSTTATGTRATRIPELWSVARRTR
jgi:hypothetical protein